MVFINAPLGMHPAYFFPAKAGKDFSLPDYLNVVEDFRNDFTIISGLSNLRTNPNAFAHESVSGFLTGVPDAGRPGFRNTVSVDQFAAEHIGDETRFSTLSLGNSSLSYTRTGAMVPADKSPSSVFARMFLAGRADEVQAQLRGLQAGQSILDVVGDQAKKTRSSLAASDRDKLDEYFTSVRELEQRLKKAEAWSRKPKPKVNAQPLKDVSDGPGKARLMLDITHLALQTDSTRLITINLGEWGIAPISGVSLEHHNLSHHGKDPDKIAQLRLVELKVMETLRDNLLVKLKQTKEEDGDSLLDKTMVFFGSHLGDAASHATTNLPILLAGGGFKHGQYLSFDAKNRTPLCNLYVSMLQRLGIETNKFGSSTGTLNGLEMVS